MTGRAADRRAAPGGLGLLVVAVVLIGLNLRAPVVGVTPLLEQISADLALSPAQAGLLTSLPLLSFAVLSPFVGDLARRLGVDRTLLLTLAVLAAATALRPWGGTAGLLVGTAVVGVAITVGNVVVPVLVRRDAPGHVSQVMALSTSSYGVGQGLATLVAVPLAAVVGWRGSITVPAALVVLALAVWALRMRAGTTTGGTAVPTPTSAPPHGWARVWREGEAWWLAAYFGAQAALFYSAATWWPTQLRAAAGLSEETAGTAVSVFHLVGIAGTLAVPVAVRLLGRRTFAVTVGLLWAVFFGGVALLPEAWAGWAVLGGLTQGAGIGLGLTLVAVRPVDAAYGRYVSGMVQGVGYALAAVGPVLVGWLAQASGGWGLPSVVLLGAGLLMAAAGVRAGADRPLGG